MIIAQKIFHSPTEKLRTSEEDTDNGTYKRVQLFASEIHKTESSGGVVRVE